MLKVENNKDKIINEEIKFNLHQIKIFNNCVKGINAKN